MAKVAAEYVHLVVYFAEFLESEDFLYDRNTRDSCSSDKCIQ